MLKVTKKHIIIVVLTVYFGLAVFIPNSFSNWLNIKQFFSTQPRTTEGTRAEIVPWGEPNSILKNPPLSIQVSCFTKRLTHDSVKKWMDDQTTDSNQSVTAQWNHIYGFFETESPQIFQPWLSFSNGEATIKAFSPVQSFRVCYNSSVTKTATVVCIEVDNPSPCKGTKCEENFKLKLPRWYQSPFYY